MNEETENMTEYVRCRIHVSFKAPVSLFLWLTCTNMLISLSLHPVLANCRQIISTPE